MSDFETPNVYGTGADSTVGSQVRTDYFYKKALVETAKEMYFGQMADVRSMPKNMGKTIKQYHYMPILDDRNINDQGIDASGKSANEDGNLAKYVIKATNGNETLYFTGGGPPSLYNSTLAAAKDQAEGNVLAYFLQKGFNTAGDTFLEFVDAGWDGDGTGTGVAGSPAAAGWEFTVADDGAMADYGNLYGSSKDIGTITGKLPLLSETGGRVNRVGMKRLELTGTIDKFGFFDEYTQESLDFDSDAELEMHITSESVKAANEITEDQLQMDLLNNAGVIRYTGNATSTAGLNGGTALVGSDAVVYDDLVKLGIELDNNRCPKNTKVITGSRMVDTMVVNAARYMYIGSELIPSVMKMTDYHEGQAFIPVAKYASAGQVARGEFGAIDNFRLIVVPEMMKWAASGATIAAGEEDDGDLFHFSSDTNGAFAYDVFPMLVVGEGSFTTIGFQTDGKTVKFKITHKKPGKEIANRDDPYGEVGFYSIKWYYGTMILRPERLACIKTVAEL